MTKSEYAQNAEKRMPGFPRVGNNSLEASEYPTEQCLDPSEVEQFLSTHELPSPRIHHLLACSFCQSVTWELK